MNVMKKLKKLTTSQKWMIAYGIIFFLPYGLAMLIRHLQGKAI
jgi:hypothetical protein